MKKSKIAIFLVVLMLMTTFLIGCAKDKGMQGDVSTDIEDSTYPMEVKDGFGYDVTIEKQPQKIVSLSPSQTEILFALGLDDQIVGVSDYCDYPSEALSKEKVGNAFAINVEKIIELEPDVVLLYSESQPEAIEQLKANGITIMIYSPETTDEIFDTITQLGKITGTVDKADQLVSKLIEKRDIIVSKVKGAEKVKVFYQVWDEPLMTAGVGSYIDELITLAGGVNIAADGEGAYPQYSAEAMIEKDPEVYLAPAHTAESYQLTSEQEQELKNIIKSRPGYEVMSAVKNDRVELLEPNIVSRPGVRIIEALELIAKAIHPDKF